MSFQSPGFLWFIPVAALPVIIHLLNRQRPRRVEFPSLMFLQASTERTLRRFRLLQVLLLAVRTILLLLVTFAFARPVWRGFASGDGGGLSYIILIDNSYSMQYRTARGSALELAVEAASEAVRLLDGQFAAGVFSSHISDYRSFTGDRRKVLEFIGNTEISAYPASYSRMMRDLREIIGDDPSADRIIIFSDFNEAGFRTDKQAEASGLKLLLADVSDGRENIWFEELNITEAYAGLPAEFTMKVSPPGSPADVSLVIDGRRSHYTEYSGSGHAGFSYTFENPGIYSGWIIMDEDAENNRIRMDSVKYFGLDVRPRTRVLLVDGRPGYTLMAGQSYFAARALSPGAYRTFAVPEVVTPRELAEISLNEFDAVLLLDVNIEGEAARALSEYSAAGGGVGIFAGENTFRSRRFISSLMPVEVDSAAPFLEDKSGIIEGSGSFSEIFSGTEDELSRFSRLLLTRSRDSSITPNVTIDGRPLLWLYSPGRGIRGNAAFFTSTANMEWNDFAVAPAYPAFIHEIVRFLAEPPEQKIIRSLPGAELPSEPGTAFSVLTESGARSLPAPVAHIPGIYRLDDSIAAVNVDTATGESELKSAQASMIKGFFRGADVTYMPFSPELISRLGRYLAGSDRSFFFLAAVFILLIAEEFLRKILSSRRAGSKL